MLLNFDNIRAFIHLGPRSFITRNSVEGLLPGRALQKYKVIVDYPGKLFTVAKPGALKPQGVAIPAPFRPESGHPRIELTIAGESFGFLLDTGATYSMIRRDLLDRWIAAHPEWRHITGAVGPANMEGNAAEPNALMIRIPEAHWAQFALKGVGVVSRPKETYEASSREMVRPIVGALAGNVLKHFRVEIDYPSQTVFLQRSDSIQEHGLNTVGLILKIDSNGKLIVVGVSPQASPRTRKNVRPGDVILRIGKTTPSVVSLMWAAQALSGTPGEKKTLLIERAGKQIPATVEVSRLL